MQRQQLKRTEIDLVCQTGGQAPHHQPTDKVLDFALSLCSAMGVAQSPEIMLPA